MTSAWDNPTWVIAVMHYPAETVLLERIASQSEITARRDIERDIQATAARTGRVAGDVLASLYGLAASPWKIAEPSLARAVHIAEKMAYEDRHLRAPRGHTRIEQCFNEMRSVAHLWAAFRLHWEYPTRPHEELMRSAAGTEVLLKIAKGVQDWALTWKPKRTRHSQPLLGADPWLVPSNVVALQPPWTEKPEWLLMAANSYRRRNR